MTRAQVGDWEPLQPHIWLSLTVSLAQWAQLDQLGSLRLSSTGHGCSAQYAALTRQLSYSQAEVTVGDTPHTCGQLSS